MSSYQKVFDNPYPNGWENFPVVDTPIVASALQEHTDAIEHIEDFLATTDIDPTTVSHLPTPTEELLGRIYQYNGPTTESYTDGYFYKCEYNDYLEEYYLSRVDVQPHQEITATDVEFDNHTSGLIADNVQDAIDLLSVYVANVEGLIDVINGEVI